ncbi:MAG TPA: glycosyltransferase family 4 protein [Beijerinckiaceae bacterium]
MTTSFIRRPARILMTLDAVGGVWRYALDLARELAARNVSVRLLGVGPAPGGAQAAEIAAFPWSWIDAPLDWMRGGLESLPRVHEAIDEAARAFDADLLHLNALAHSHERLRAWPIVAFTHSCVPSWIAAMGGDVAESWCATHRAANAAGFRAADVVAAPSEAHARATAALYGAGPLVRAVHNAVAPAPASRRREPFVFAAGRWWDDAKNLRTLDEAAATTRWPVRLAGPLEGPNGERRTLRHAETLGVLDAQTTRETMARAAIFVSPSAFEPFGLAALEAASSGAALVLSDIPTYRELWEGAALFAPPKDAAAFARAIDQLADDADLRARLGFQARARAARRTPARQADEMLRIYGEALRLRAPACAPAREAV